MNFLKLTNFLQCKSFINFCSRYSDHIKVWCTLLNSQRHVLLEINRGIDHLQPARNITFALDLELYALIVCVEYTPYINEALLWPVYDVLLPQ